jgi:single-strand DNA-binding protein
MYLNQIVLAGNLGKDAEVREVTSSQGTRTVLNLRLACTRRWRSGGVNQEATEWFSVVFWPASEAQSNYLREVLTKGASVLVVGEVRFKTFTDKDGIERERTEVHASKVEPAPVRRDDKPAEAPEPPPGDAESTVDPKTGFSRAW